MNILKKIGEYLGMILIYIALIIDRAILIPFPFWSSYSAQELTTKPDRYSGYVMIRVITIVVIAAIWILIKWIF